MFSVVIPLYNKRSYIADALQAVSSQTLAPIDIIVVDDGSTDGSYEIVEKMSLPGLRLLRTGLERSGPSVARNVGIDAARSNWIAFLDADDSWDPDYLAEVRRCIEKINGECCCVLSAWNINFGAGAIPSPIAKQLVEPMTLNFGQFVAIWTRLKYCPMWTSAVVVNRRQFLEVGGFPEDVRRGEDKVAWFRIMQQGLGVYNPKALAVYNLDIPDQETKRYSNMKHPLCLEIDELRDLHGAQRKDVRRLYNLQIIVTLRLLLFRDKIRRDVCKDFDPLLNPAYFILIIFSRLVPISIQKLVGRLFNR